MYLPLLFTCTKGIYRVTNICFTGNRECYLNVAKIEHKLTQLIKKLNTDNILFISGGAEGFDTLTALAVIKLKGKYKNLKLELAIPFKEYRSDSKFKYILNNSDIITYVDNIIGYKNPIVPIGKYHMGKLFSRNRYMIDKSKIVIAYSNKKSGGTCEAIKYSKLNKIKLLYIK